MEKHAEIRDKPHNQNRTEHKLYIAMKGLGLKPEPQYKISDMTVDFAFPDKKIVIEVHGFHHDNEKQQANDYRRECVLKKLGWLVKAYKASSVHKNPVFIAEKIKEQIDEINVVETSPKIEVNPEVVPKLEPKDEGMEKTVTKRWTLMKSVIVGCIIIGTILAVLFVFTGTSNNSNFDCSYNKYDCTDFDTHAEAQELFEACGGTSNDIHYLDGDKDGLVCEMLP